jgi:hypothetical protein
MMLSYADDKATVKERFFGRIEEIWELDYAGEKVPMFRVRWAKSVACCVVNVTPSNL